MPEAPWSKRKSAIYSFLYRNPKSTKLTVSHADLQSSDEVLDIGCGPGGAVRLAAEQATRAVGVDASEPMIAIAAQRSAHVANASFHVSPAESLAFDDDSFTVVWTIQSWHHWNDPSQAFQEVRRILKPGGRFMIMEKNTKGAHGILPSEAQQLASTLTTAGFTNAGVAPIGKYLAVTGHAAA